MSRRRFKLFPNPFAISEVLGPLGICNSDAFSVFQDAIASRHAFNSGKRRCEKLAITLGCSAEEVAILLSLLSSLYQRLRALEKTYGESSELLSDFIAEMLDESEAIDDDGTDGLGDEGRTALLSRLPILLAKNDNVKEAEKRSRLRAGFIKSATGFSTFVDLRPNFINDYAEINGFVPVTQVRITTDSENSSDRELVFQCSQEALAKLKKVIDEASDKLRTLANHPEFGKHLDHQEDE